MQDLDQLIPTLPTDRLAVVDVVPEITVKQARRITRRVASRRFATLRQHQTALQHLDPLPRPGESLHGVTSGAYSAWSLATAIIELLRPAIVEQMTVATLGFNRQNADSLCQLLDAGAVRHVLLLVSDYFRSSDRTIFADIRRDLQARGQRVAIARSHAKLLLFQAGDKSIVLETSANLRSSVNWEQFCIADDPALLAFHRTWIEDLISEEACKTP